MKRPELHNYSYRETNHLYSPEYEIDMIKYVEYLEDVVKNCSIPDISQEKRTVCHECGDKGWLYNNEGRRTGTCPCHY